MDFFSQIEPAMPDAVFGINQTAKADPRPGKVNLTVGVYRTETLTTPVLNCVKKLSKSCLSPKRRKNISR